MDIALHQRLDFGGVDSCRYIIKLAQIHRGKDDFIARVVGGSIFRYGIFIVAGLQNSRFAEDLDDVEIKAIDRNAANNRFFLKLLRLIGVNR